MLLEHWLVCILRFPVVFLCIFKSCVGHEVGCIFVGLLFSQSFSLFIVFILYGFHYLLFSFFMVFIIYRRIPCDTALYVLLSPFLR